MNRTLSLLLLIVLILAVPLRALAGVAVPCMTAHAATMPVTMQSMDHPGVQMADHDCHDAQSCDHVKSHPAQDLCKLCADCCLGSASIPVHIRLALGDRTVSDILLLPVHGYAGFMPEGPERPPRHTVS